MGKLYWDNDLTESIDDNFSNNTVNDSNPAQLRWTKYGNTIKAVNRFRGVEREV